MMKNPAKIAAAGGQAGFTLLELLLVVAILSSLALAATTFVENADDQQRFEETGRRLDLIRFAIVGENRPVYGGQALLSGYVADNGVMPGSMADLLTLPAGYGDFSLQSPVFDADPDASGLNDGTNETSLTDGAEQLAKGHRGAYLSGNSQGQFLDGWGNAGSAPNYGWNVTTTPTFTVASLGRDFAVGGAGYDTDLSRSITAPSWQFPNVAGWQVTVRNSSGADIQPGASNFRASLLVYGNNAGAAGRWRRFTTDRATACLDGTGDGQVSGSSCSDHVTLTFPSGGYPGGSLATAIHQGRHILVLVQDSDDTAHTGNSDQLYDRDTSAIGIQAVTQQLSIFAGMTPPGAELVIR